MLNIIWNYFCIFCTEVTIVLKSSSINISVESLYTAPNIIAEITIAAEMAKASKIRSASIIFKGLAVCGSTHKGHHSLPASLIADTDLYPYRSVHKSNGLYNPVLCNHNAKGSCRFYAR